ITFGSDPGRCGRAPRRRWQCAFARQLGARSLTWARLLFAAAVALFSACLAGIGIAAWWIGTAAGTAWLVNALEPRISQWVTFADVSGALWEGVTIRDLHVHTGTMELFVERLAMTLDPAELLSGTIAVQRLDV